MFRKKDSREHDGTASVRKRLSSVFVCLLVAAMTLVLALSFAGCKGKSSSKISDPFTDISMFDPPSLKKVQSALGEASIFNEDEGRLVYKNFEYHGLTGELLYQNDGYERIEFTCNSGVFKDDPDYDAKLEEFYAKCQEIVDHFNELYGESEYSVVWEDYDWVKAERKGIKEQITVEFDQYDIEILVRTYD